MSQYKSSLLRQNCAFFKTPGSVYQVFGTFWVARQKFEQTLQIWASHLDLLESRLGLLPQQLNLEQQIMSGSQIIQQLTQLSRGPYVSRGTRQQILYLLVY
jgi:hypothetical protein